MIIVDMILGERDPRQLEEFGPADARDHLAWGSGVHMCAGLYLARMEMEVMLEALVESGATPRTGAPVAGANKGLFGFTALPYELTR